MIILISIAFIWYLIGFGSVFILFKVAEKWKLTIVDIIFMTVVGLFGVVTMATVALIMLTDYKYYFERE